jgi:CheY-like chemotaxis protein
MTVPRVNGVQPEPGSAVSKLKAVGLASQMSHSSKQTVLLVEDYKDTREMLRLLLEDLDYTVLLAENSEEALALVSQDEPDLILTDYNLPDTNGIEFIWRVRHFKRKTKPIPIILITAYDLDELHTSAVEAGCTAFFKKPIHFDELAETVSNLLEESKREEPSHQ